MTPTDNFYKYQLHQKFFHIVHRRVLSWWLFVYKDNPYSFFSAHYNLVHYNLNLNGNLKKLDSQGTNEHLFFINDLKGHAYTALKDADSLKLIALNINNTGDIYTIYANSRQIITKTSDGYVQCEKISDEVGIYKNYQLVSKIDLKDLLRQSISNVRSRSKRGLEGDRITDNAPDIDMLIDWGVIEDEHHWAFTILVQSNTTNGGIVNSSDIIQNKIRYEGTASKQTAYLHTPSGLSCFFDSESGFADYQGYGYTGQLWNEDDSKINIPTEHIPIQDGYYFTVNNIKLGNSSYFYYKEVPAFADISIYTPEDKLVFSGEFIIGTRFGICKAKSVFFLEINDMQGAGLFGSKLFYDLWFRGAKAEEGKISSGVYKLKNLELEKIVDGYPTNQKLRLASKRKSYWYENAFRLDDSTVRKTLSTDNEIWNL